MEKREITLHTFFFHERNVLPSMILTKGSFVRSGSGNFMILSVSSEPTS